MSLPHADELDRHASAKCLLEASAERDPLFVYALVQLVRKGNLLLVVFRQKTDLSWIVTIVIPWVLMDGAPCKALLPTLCQNYG
jgi:hypothetical protein